MSVTLALRQLTPTQRILDTLTFAIEGRSGTDWILTATDLEPGDYALSIRTTGNGAIILEDTWLRGRLLCSGGTQ